MRSFIAVDLANEEVKDKLVEIQKEIKALHSGKIKLVKPENLHLTLKFLGEIEDTEVEELEEMLEGFKEYSQQEINVSELGVFPHYGYMKVIWAGLKENETLKQIKSELEDKSAELGFDRDTKDFHPHITIGRVKNIWAKDKLVNKLKEFVDQDFGKLKLDKLKLKKSTLTSDGPVYETISEVELN
ncbi:RNA 2',3'-cyclic phosphodiesterase [Acetohalobium arabaticum]|uniref:RNA 2',3'-cyclic phosphodiesterase n=1 Tax=Acetohalobium arabaticum (strain ATCC 49924 / DSM 5501 / Z-7288) TaxID=574087 RepID=D9QVE9_ACEAZ|nr:RNA 2',3'-cyclic phosphodiesterase [Acetohalobium arabaticum]ADL12208.1 2'-5' RNA ligase [Acetohalobium arabaticum DSM 5501]